MSNAQILVVEDEYIVAKDIQDTLSNLGYSVPAIAASGEEALKKISELKPDLVLMDIVLKGELDGVQTADQIRLNFDIPVVYLTAYADSETLKRARVTEPYGYLIKPFQEKELHTTIEMALYRQKMERKLRKNEQWLSITLHSISEGVIATDEKGYITFVNPTAEIMLAKRQEDVLNKLFNDIISIINENTGDKIKSPIDEVLESGKNIEMSENLIFFTEEELEIPIEFSASPIKDQNENIYGVVLLFQDITIRKDAELVLKESEERYRKLVDNFPEPMIVYGEGKIKYMNPETIQLFGANSSVELIGKSIIDFVHSDYQSDIKARIREIEIGKELQKSINIRILTLTGTEKIIDISASHISYYGKPAVQIVLKDITDDKIAEERLRESEEKYRSLVERAKDGIGIIQDGLLRYLNPATERMTGYDVNEILNKPFSDFLHPDAKAKVIDHYKRRMAGEDVPGIYEASIMDKDGSKKEIEINAGIIHFDGKPADLVIIRDISERKRIENALRESEEKYRTLVETSPDAIVYADLKGNIQMVNKQALELYGCETEEGLIGKNIMEFISAEDRSRATENLQKGLKGKKINNVQYKLFRIDGTLFQGEINTALIHDSEKNPKGFIGIVRDITERIKFELALRDSEEKYRLFVNNINDGVYTLDNKGYFTFVNKIIEDRSGVTIEKFRKLHFNDIVTPEYHKKTQRNFERVMKGEEVPPYELEYAKADGSRLFVEINTKPIYEEEKVIGLQGISRDITERKAVEKALRDSENQLSLVLNSMGDAIHVIDRDFQIIMLNTYFKKWNKELGLETDVLDKNIFDVYPFLPKKVREEYKEVFDTGKTLSTIEDTKIGEKKFFTETIKIPIIIKDEVKQIITIIRNITERKLSEERIQESEERYRGLFEKSPDSITLLDKSGIITDCNSKTEELIGHSKNEIIGKKFEELTTMDPKDLPRMRDFYLKLLSGEEVEPKEFEIMRKDGAKRKVHVVTSILTKDNEVIGFQTIARDITESKLH
jgi:PAS domain S-box-containing protein